MYLLYVMVGLPLTIVVTVYIALRSDPSEPEILPIAAPVLVWVAGLLILQWTSLLTDGVGPAAPEGEEPQAGTAAPPLDREALHAVLRVDGGHVSSAPTSRSFAVRGFLLFTAFTIALPAGALLYITGIVGATISPLGAGGPAIPVAVLPGLALVAFGVLRLAGQYRQATRVADSYLKDLGLRLDGPSPPVSVAHPKGATARPPGGLAYAGERHGWPVRIEQSAGASSVHVANPMPPFVARELDLALSPEPGTPPAVVDALAELSPHPRWANVRVTAGDDGVLVERQVDASMAYRELWLDDLWLAERLVSVSDNRI
jgi:hypothetical protein